MKKGSHMKNMPTFLKIILSDIKNYYLLAFSAGMELAGSCLLTVIVIT